MLFRSRSDQNVNECSAAPLNVIRQTWGDNDFGTAANVHCGFRLCRRVHGVGKRCGDVVENLLGKSLRFSLPSIARFIGNADRNGLRPPANKGDSVRAACDFGAVNWSRRAHVEILRVD